MQLHGVQLVLQLLLLISVLATAREAAGDDAKELARPYLNLMKQRQAQRVEEMAFKRKAYMETEEKTWEKKGLEWGSLMSEELGVVRQFPNWWPWGTRPSRQDMEPNLARGTMHQEL